MIVTKNGHIIQVKEKRKNFSILYFSDVHYDSGYSKTKWLHSTIKKYPDDLIVFGGDFIDAMQFKKDPRHVKGELKGCLNKTDYGNQLVKLIRKEIVNKYQDRIISINNGNHEAAVTKNQEVDLIEMALMETGIPHGDLAGYLLITVPRNKHKQYSHYLIYYQHIPISGGHRSKGMLSVDIVKSYYPDPNMYLTEHIHDTFIKPEYIEKFNRQTGNIYYDSKWYIQNTTLKAEYTDKNGFHYLKGAKAIKPLGCVRLNFEFNNFTKRLDVSPQFLLCPPIG